MVQALDILSNIHVGGYIALVLAIICFSLIPVSSWWTRRQEAKRAAAERSKNGDGTQGKVEPVPFFLKRKKVGHPVIGYKTANIVGIALGDDSSITDVVFEGLIGHSYGVADDTKQSGHRKFNMYRDIEQALDHEQNWGSTLLEAVGYGNVEAHDRGYTSQSQRVLQMAFLECSYFYKDNIKCTNKPAFLGSLTDDTEETFQTYCAGCVEKTSRSYPLELFLNRSYTLKSGETVVVGGASTREQVSIVPTALPDAESGSDSTKSTKGKDGLSGDRDV